VVKALGTRHSFSNLADSTGTHIDLAELDAPMQIDRAAGTVIVGAAARYGDFVPVLHEAGLALQNLPSLPHCTVAGSIATATNGSGLRNQNLAAAVSGVELVTADGDVRQYTREGDPDVFPALAVNLGALGVLTRVTLDLVAAFELRQDGYTGLSWDAVLADWQDVQNAGYSVSLFTRWTGDPAGLFPVKTQVEHDTAPSAFRLAARLDPDGKFRNATHARTTHRQPRRRRTAPVRKGDSAAHRGQRTDRGRLPLWHSGRPAARA
jgi:xylitol oxidase